MCSEREADPVAMAYLKAGYHVFVLYYSVKPHAVWPQPLEDYDAAVDLIRSKADEWMLYPDKIACVGFSAGGHLAACAASAAKHRPAAAILGYPAVCEDIVHLCLREAPLPASLVNKDTSPCFLFATRNDGVVPIKSTVEMINALIASDIAFESHIYAFGPHGFSTATSDLVIGDVPLTERAREWVEDSIGWMKEVIGDFGKGEMTAPRCPRRLNANGEPYFSAGCTLAYLMENEQTKRIIQPFLDMLINMLAGNEGREKGAYKLEFIKGLYTLNEAMQTMQCPAVQIMEYDAALNKIKNK